MSPFDCRNNESSLRQEPLVFQDKHLSLYQPPAFEFNSAQRDDKGLRERRVGEHSCRPDRAV